MNRPWCKLSLKRGAHVKHEDGGMSEDFGEPCPFTGELFDKKNIVADRFPLPLFFPCKLRSLLDV